MELYRLKTINDTTDSFKAQLTCAKNGHNLYLVSTKFIVTFLS